MDMQALIPTAASFGVAAFVIILVIAGLFRLNTYLVKRYEHGSSAEFQRQLIMLAVSLLALIFVVLVIPVGDAMRGQILGLLGIVLSATIALSSTTLVGNVLAGLMLKSLKGMRPGVHIRVQDCAGRISSMSLLYTEIQTEDRDLTSLPNLFLATNPVTMYRSSGTILSVEVSLGYDVPRQQIEGVLLEAATEAGLQKPFVQITSLGDFSVSYRIAGLAEDLDQVISTRRKLRSRVLDGLHGAGIEIVSPNFMNTRSLADGQRMMPPVFATDSADAEEKDSSPDDVVFDKARKADSVEKLRESRAAVVERIAACQDELKELKSDADSEAYKSAEKELGHQEQKLEHLDRVIASAEARIAED
jgi:small-conductance mechanosensitive channel